MFHYDSSILNINHIEPLKPPLQSLCVDLQSINRGSVFSCSFNVAGIATAEIKMNRKSHPSSAGLFHPSIVNSSSNNYMTSKADIFAFTFSLLIYLQFVRSFLMPPKKLRRNVSPPAMRLSIILVQIQI